MKGSNRWLWFFWVLGGGSLTCALIAVVYLSMLQEGSPPAALKSPKGMWRPLQPRPATDNGPDEEQRRRMMRLESLSYLAGYHRAPAMKNVTVYKEGQTYDGLNLVFSGHGPEAVLMDMQGRRQYIWRKSYQEARAQFPQLRPPQGGSPWPFRRGHLYPNGDLLVIFEGFGLIKLDRYSNVLWVFPKACHHDLFVEKDGLIHILTRRARIVTRLDPSRPMLLDYLSVISPEGKLLSELSLLECFERSEFTHLLRGIKLEEDPFHTNTIEVLDGRHAHRSPIFSQGNLLISVRRLNTIAIINPEQKKVIWALAEGWREQHEPSLLDNGNMLLFDNLGNEGRSRVLEIDPLSKKLVWEYKGPTGSDLFSAECGTTVRLPNGNTLITESLNGRAVEVTPDKRIVWEFYNPHRAGKQNELIATLFDVVRLPAGLTLPWLQKH